MITHNPEATTYFDRVCTCGWRYRRRSACGLTWQASPNLSRTFFWTPTSAARGKYDLAVILILVFACSRAGLVPRSAAKRRASTPGQVQLISQDGNHLKYRVDARILASRPTKLALQNDLHTALQEAFARIAQREFLHLQ